MTAAYQDEIGISNSCRRVVRSDSRHTGESNVLFPHESTDGHRCSGSLTELWFYIPLDTKCVKWINGVLLPAAGTRSDASGWVYLAVINAL